MRVEYLKLLGEKAATVMADLSGGEELRLGYKSDVAVADVLSPHGENEIFVIPTTLSRDRVKDEYYRILTREVSREIAVGSSLWGPHRDDVTIELCGIPARGFASQGQCRSIVLALKLAEGEVIREIFGEYPVFLFDDVLSELDERRRRYIIEGMAERQIIITSCERDEIQSFADRIIEVKGGEYVLTHG
jgi:recombinational DNA repair ATPase RecF